MPSTGLRECRRGEEKDPETVNQFLCVVINFWNLILFEQGRSFERSGFPLQARPGQEGRMDDIHLK